MKPDPCVVAETTADPTSSSMPSRTAAGSSDHVGRRAVCPTGNVIGTRIASHLSAPHGVVTLQTASPCLAYDQHRPGSET